MAKQYTDDNCQHNSYETDLRFHMTTCSTTARSHPAVHSTAITECFVVNLLTMIKTNLDPVRHCQDPRFMNSSNSAFIGPFPIPADREDHQSP